MHQAAVVRVLQPQRCFANVRARLAGIERPFASDDGSEVQPLDIPMARKNVSPIGPAS